MVGTELEFILFNDSYEQAWDKRYQDLIPSNQWNLDYSILGTARVEPLLRAIRLGMRDSGLQVESAKGECNPGQQEIAFKYTNALATCDNHVIYKNGAKEIAAQHGSALTFMAKYDQREGNSCHIHLSLRAADGDPVFAGLGEHGTSPLFDHFLAGQISALRELSYFFAPNINSYKRYQAGSFAPTAVMWGLDNRTCSLRVVGRGPSLRFENRVPGGDVNPYLAVAAMIAAGLHGVDNNLPLEAPFGGNAYEADAPRVPESLAEAADLLEGSRIARDALGDVVVDHYTNAARVEVAAFNAAVTDWERFRSFERM
jgi:glutamine synthetase